MQQEHRSHASLEIRADTPSGLPEIAGHSAVFDTPAQLWPGFSEVIRPGSFSRAIAEDDVWALVQHEPRDILGRNQAGTLDLSEDAVGLFYVARPEDTQASRDAVTNIRARNLTGSSFAFKPSPGGAHEEIRSDGTILRVVEAVKLFDVGPGAYTVYAEATVALRSFVRDRDEDGATRLVRHALDHGLSPESLAGIVPEYANVVGGEAAQRAAETAAEFARKRKRLDLELAH